MPKMSIAGYQMTTNRYVEHSLTWKIISDGVHWITRVLTLKVLNF